MFFQHALQAFLEPADELAVTGRAAGAFVAAQRLQILVVRAAAPEVTEVILATSATVEGQTTAHYVTDRLAECGVTVSRLAHGVPIGGELDYLDDGTLGAALNSRRPI